MVFPDTPAPESESGPRSSKRIVYQTETTGSYWGDVKEAVKRVGEIPCARSSLLSGIASGVGVGVIRGLSAGPFVASNWAVGTFVVISLGTWTVCQKSLHEERRRIQQVVEQIPKRYAKEETSASTSQEGSRS
ncbi:uncharacterized protein LAESUDRAFT_735510 [Laetiporus sulphureus 93-53]|uniref:Cytochrome c oxidase assembly protein COX20, mitochondrial n=1 Tax=Laetiporus sulphureus 93-53 TaxID=1314785 RepID=A0A165FNI5_9APHY|nr:uncharacterized protein LAESUDRAFT_735510 [Laetiporus sulphureus 93-53]KZT09235.1 hypothetical protein LAESUDRAFT_735510 [Laetiporus sulphureus 93-53]